MPNLRTADPLQAQHLALDIHLPADCAKRLSRRTARRLRARTVALAAGVAGGARAAQRPLPQMAAVRAGPVARGQSTGGQRAEAAAAAMRHMLAGTRACWRCVRC